MPAPADDHPVVAAVRELVEREVRPVAIALERADRYPHQLVARLRELGLFGCLIPVEHGGLGLDVTTYARVIEELCRGWMSLAGVINSHTMLALIVLHHGTEEQRRRFLPRLAAGQARGGLGLTEPQAGSDVQAIRTVARRRDDHYLITGSKMFVTNGREGDAFAVLALTDPAATPRHRGMSCFVVEKGHPGLRVVKSIGKLGYRGVDTAELVFDEVEVPAANLVGGVEGRGFKQVLGGLETGRINIAARAAGVARAALERTVARVRAAGTPAPPRLADMAVRVEAARSLTYWAAAMKDRAQRCDLEAGLAKLLASEAAQAVAEAALALHGEAGELAEHEVERCYRDTPLMIIGEGTNEIQRTLIARQLVERYGERPGALSGREGEPGERRQMVLTVRQFVDREVAPVAAGLEAGGRYPERLLAGLADLGLLGALVAPEEGGLGLDLATWAMIVEELARGWTAVAALVAAHTAAAALLARFAGPAGPRTHLPRLVRGELGATLALTGAVVGRRTGEGWALSGATGRVEAGGRAEVVVVRADLDGAPALVVVDRSTPGLAPGPRPDTLGGGGLEARDLHLAAVAVPPAAVLGAPDGGRAEAGAVALGLARLGLAATGVGLAQAAFEAALRYAQQRVAFGQPIWQHQAIQLKLADMATALTAARLLTARAAGRLEADPGDPAAAMARLAAAEAARTVTLEAMRVHGGYGYTTEFPVERYYREAPRLGLALGGEEAERAGLAARLVGG